MQGNSIKNDQNLSIESHFFTLILPERQQKRPAFISETGRQECTIMIYSSIHELFLHHALTLQVANWVPAACIMCWPWASWCYQREERVLFPPGEILSPDKYFPNFPEIYLPTQHKQQQQQQNIKTLQFDGENPQSDECTRDQQTIAQTKAPIYKSHGFETVMPLCTYYLWLLEPNG